MKESKEINMWTQGYSVWLVKVLLILLAWLIFLFLIDYALLFFGMFSPGYSLIIAVALSTAVFGTIAYRICKFS